MKRLQSTSTEVAEFLRQAAKMPVTSAPHGRLIFALDATASRQPMLRWAFGKLPG